MSERIFDSNICLAAVGHDPQGRWADYLSKGDPLLSNLYPNRLISLTERTHNSTIDRASELGWEVTVEELSVGSARFASIRRGLATGNPFINYWDGDRLLHATEYAREELKDIVTRIPNYDCFIAGATREAIVTHQPSMTSWEEVKSWALGHYIGIKGDIATRGCFGFSREFGLFLVQHEDSKGDETDAIFAILPLAFRSLIDAGQLPETGRETVGYHEYDRATAYEDWMFEGLTPEESAKRKNSPRDFNRRAEAVLRALVLAENIGQQYNLGFPSEGGGIKDMLKRLAEQL